MSLAAAAAAMKATAMENAARLRTAVTDACSAAFGIGVNSSGVSETAECAGMRSARRTAWSKSVGVGDYTERVCAMT
jgi:hypothetical protein